MLSKFGPNIDILKQPSNWFLVAFSIAILILISHVFLKGSNNGSHAT